MALSPDLATAAAHWSAVSGEGDGRITSWWQHPQILEHVNRQICGFSVGGSVTGDLGLISWMRAGKPLESAVSVGCGHGMKEMSLLGFGIVDHFHLYEISEARVAQGRELADRFDLTERITWHESAADFSTPLDVDLVYWNNALHHMLDVEAAVRWSKESLNAGGLLYVNDYVGPNLMQWDEEMLDIAERVRATLPERLIGSDPVRPVPPDATSLAADDPTESVQSESILPALRSHCPDVHVMPIGGVVYHLALKGVIERLEPEDEDFLGVLLLLDEAYAKAGTTHYAVALWQKPATSES